MIEGFLVSYLLQLNCDLLREVTLDPAHLLLTVCTHVSYCSSQNPEMRRYQLLGAFPFNVPY